MFIVDDEDVYWWWERHHYSNRWGIEWFRHVLEGCVMNVYHDQAWSGCHRGCFGD